MNKENLVNLVAEKAQTTKDMANKAINAVVEGISLSLVDNFLIF